MLRMFYDLFEKREEQMASRGIRLALPPAEDVTSAAEAALRRTGILARAMLGFDEAMSRRQVRFAAQTYSAERLLEECYTFPVLGYTAALVDVMVYEFVLLQVAPPYAGPTDEPPNPTS